MPILKSLTFTAVPARSSDPVAGRRAKLIGRLEEQKVLLSNAAYVRTVQRWTGKGDERRQIEKQQRVRPWWRADVRGIQPDAARAHPAGRDVLSEMIGDLLRTITETER